MPAWPVIVFGAPGACIALLVCIGGLLHERPGWMVVGGLLFAPSALYLAGHPGGAGLALMPLIPWLAAYLLHRGRKTAAGLLLVPNALATAWLVIATLRNLC